ncbi:tetratricopeptide repeat protein [Campylobacter sp. RM16191]|uniref:tetratricopeptide repeat protein n=1 Tax=Campylobacter sp. RM16191 TaxID=1705728 RepID=UPI00147540C4|nr:tetratricopeptide repeat protein [Campylobacter sp. RM16191]
MKILVVFLSFFAILLANECVDASSCFEEGSKAAFSGDYMLSNKFYKKACEMGHQGACERMKEYEDKKEAINMQVSAEQFNVVKKSCESGDVKQCESLATFYMSGKGTKQDYKSAYEIAKSWCDKGEAKFCTLAGMLNDDGVLGEANYQEAMKYYEKACEKLDAQACTNLGLIYISGRGVSADMNLGVSYVNKGCENGDVNGCVVLGEFYFKNKDYDKAKPYLKATCENGNGVSCMYMGIALMPKDFRGQISVEAAAYFDRACKLGIKEGCL